jgi:hypothetical protein
MNDSEDVVQDKADKRWLASCNHPFWEQERFDLGGAKLPCFAGLERQHMAFM